MNQVISPRSGRGTVDTNRFNQFRTYLARCSHPSPRRKRVKVIDSATALVLIHLPLQGGQTVAEGQQIKSLQGIQCYDGRDQGGC